jgi:hypothetical protein
MISHNFAYLVPPEKQNTDPVGMCTLHAICNSLVDGKGSYEPRGSFRPCLEDELLYLICLRDGIWGNDAKKKPVKITSTNAFTQFRTSSGYLNRKAPNNPGKMQEEEVLAGAVFASHRGDSLDGQGMLSFLANLLGELAPQLEFRSEDFVDVPLSLKDHLAILNFQVKLLSPPLLAGSLMIEVKDVAAGTSSAGCASYSNKLYDSGCAVCMLVARSIKKFKKKDHHFNAHVAVYRVTARDTIVLEHDATQGDRSTQKIMLLVDLESVFPGRSGYVKHVS